MQVVPTGGAGNKVYRIITGQVDSYVEPRRLLKFWDLCAPEVLLRAMGGTINIIPENKGDELKTPLYDENQPKSPRISGFSAARTVTFQR